MNKEIQKFVEKYNNTLIPAKYNFELVENLYYAWNYEVSNIKLFVMIKSVSETKVVLHCKRSNKIGRNFTSVEIELTEPPYWDFYQTVYHFLVEAVENTEALIELESKMKF